MPPRSAWRNDMPGTTTRNSKTNGTARSSARRLTFAAYKTVFVNKS